MPGIVRAMERDAFEKAARAQGRRGRVVPQATQIAAFVDRKAPALTRRLKKVLQAYARRIAPGIARAYGAQLGKDAGPKRDVIASLIDQLGAESLGEELTGDLEGAMLSAFRRAAARGTLQVGFDVTAEITKQVDRAAVDYAARRGGELMKDFADTTEKDMRALLSRAVNEGMSTDELEDAVLGLGSFGESRAEMIARTELAFAHVQGNKEGWAASGVRVRKRSILGDLHDIEDICDEAAAAGVVDMDEEFVDGAKDPPYHPRCVCDIEPVIEDEPQGADE